MRLIRGVITGLAPTPHMEATVAKPASTESVFPTMDFSKIFESFKVPGLEMDSMMDTQRRNVQALIDAQRATAEAYQSVFRRQVELMQGSVESLTGAMKEMMSQDSPTEAASKQMEFVRKAFETNLANLREIAELTAGAHTEAFKIVQERLNQNLAQAKPGNGSAPPARAAN